MLQIYIFFLINNLRKKTINHAKDLRFNYIILIPKLFLYICMYMKNYFGSTKQQHFYYLRVYSFSDKNLIKLTKIICTVFNSSFFLNDLWFNWNQLVLFIQTTHSLYKYIMYIHIMHWIKTVDTTIIVCDLKLFIVY